MLTEQIFLNDVKDHNLKILRNDGLYRHIILSQEDTYHHWFELITWPNHLCINGDMGTYTFSRVEDMFKFFRSSDGPLYVNTDYWAQKCTARSAEEISEFSEEIFKSRIKEWYKDFISGVDISDIESEELWQEIDDEFSGVSSNAEAYEAADAYKSRKYGRIFEDFSEVDCEDYTYQYRWCCYAIVWAIKEYDSKTGKSESSAL